MTKKITIKAGLLQQLSQLANLTTGVTVIPITRSVLLEQDDAGNRFVSTSDGKCYRQTPTDGFEADGPVSICVEHARLFSTLKTHGDLECTISYKKDKTYGNALAYKLDGKSGIGKVQLPLDDGREFVVKPNLTEYHDVFQIPAYAFRSAIDNAKKFVMPGDYGAANECVGIEVANKWVYITGTDRNQIYLAAVKPAQPEDLDEVKFVIPNIVFNKLTYHLPDADVQLQVKFKPGRGGVILFDTNDWVSFSIGDGEQSPVVDLVSMIETDICIEADNYRLKELFIHLMDLVDIKMTTEVDVRVTDTGLYLSANDSLSDRRSEVFIETAIDGLVDPFEFTVDGLKFKAGLSVFNDVVKIETKAQPGSAIKIMDRDADPDFRDVFVLAPMRRQA